MAVEILKRKNWKAEAARYEVRLDDATRRTAFYSPEAGCKSWIVQILDNEDNQIGDAEFYYNKAAFPTYY